MHTRPLPLALTLAMLTALALLAGCEPRGLRPEDLPTAITDLDALATAQLLTQNAPPPFFRDGVRLPRIDDGADELPNWRAEVQLRFDGVFAGTSRQTSASTDATLWFNLLGTRRRVLLDVRGELLTPPSDLDDRQQIEGVRFGRELYVVQDGQCAPVDPGGGAANAGDTPVAPAAAAIIADLSAGDLLGGVRQALPNGRRAVINGSEVWGYSFLEDDLILPSLIPQPGGSRIITGGELWFAPQHNAAVRFYLTVEVDNATVFGSQLPVTGQIVMRYDLFDVGVDPNITVPFGC